MDLKDKAKHFFNTVGQLRCKMVADSELSDKDKHSIICLELVINVFNRLTENTNLKLDDLLDKPDKTEPPETKKIDVIEDYLFQDTNKDTNKDTKLDPPKKPEEPEELDIEGDEQVRKLYESSLAILYKINTNKKIQVRELVEI